jgi:arylsulfatase A-like enzyme
MEVDLGSSIAEGTRPGRAAGAACLIGFGLVAGLALCEWAVLLAKLPVSSGAGTAGAVLWSLFLYGLGGCAAGLAVWWLLSALSVVSGRRLLARRNARLSATWALLLSGVIGLYWVVDFNVRYQGQTSGRSALVIDAALALASIVLAALLIRLTRRRVTGAYMLVATLVAVAALWLPWHIPAAGHGTTRLLTGFDLGPVRSAQAADDRAGAPKIVFIMMDTTRTDALGCYGGSEVRTPNIDALADESILFENCVTNEPLTRPAVCTMFTGLYPRSHGVDSNTKKLPDDLETLAETLSGNGYVTGAFTAASVLSADFGTAQGFDVYTEPTGASWEPTGGLILARLYRAFATWRSQEIEVRADGITAAATEWMGNNSDRPFFAFVHYFDPHHPYEPLPDYDLAAREGLSDVPAPYADRGEMYSPGFVMPEDFLRKMWLRYLGEVEYTDHFVGELLGSLDALGIADETVVVLAVDHGEGFDHDHYFGHGNRLYDTLIHVPLIIRWPGGPGPMRVEKQVELIDLRDSILSILDIDAESETQGEDFTVNLSSDPDPVSGRPAFSQTNFENPRPSYRMSLGLRLPPWKYIESPELGLVELYDLESDPAELVNLSSERPEIRDSMSRLLREWVAGTETRAVAPEELTPEKLEALRALGYIQ